MTTGGATGFYKTKGVSNYEISTALYGAKDKDTVTDESEDAVGGKNLHLFQVLLNFDLVETLHSVPRGVQK